MEDVKAAVMHEQQQFNEEQTRFLHKLATAVNLRWRAMDSPTGEKREHGLGRGLD